ncbi:protein NO VEIN domain-containing protein [Promicromonospora iranensis]|uniref:Protein NO VEIN C-terminal domain-containing protein n=1 Tax=Promicromonospora iranensis TaxID=1105144 RepID=A0ABU2CST1_9MICO|nr:DUF3883 domain-containing protein [Promicromonospora iranensis]MDR7384398.1 hypothetical protein [Promicromonospora iranensis]
MPATFLTWNPARSTLMEQEWTQSAALTRAGEPVKWWWSVGRHVHIPRGRRVFLLRQGSGPRGIVAAGITTSVPYLGERVDGEEKATNRVDVSWDAMIVDPREPLSVQYLLAEAPGIPWNNIQGSGTSTADDGAVVRIEDLWARRLADEEHPVALRRTRPAGQGWESDSAVRRAIEDYAQDLLTAHFVADGWSVQDTRVARPYDAVATRDDEVLYLEAKGTRSDGTSVLVTAGEVRWAAAHKGQCRIGIVSHIKVRDGRVVPGSGDLVVREWRPKSKELSPTAYRWTPRT